MTTRPWPCWPTWPTAAASARPAAWSGSAPTRWPATPCAPAATPARGTTSWWAFPPSTREVQLDEKWAFVGKKQEHCDPDDPADWFCGDPWDHVALDPASRLVLEALHRLMANRTTFVIAHHLYTIQRAHRIMVLDQGRISEWGTHEQLLERNERYAKLYHTQFHRVPQGATG